MRDVIHVERHPEVPDVGPADTPALAGRTDGPVIDRGSLAAVGRVADEVLPSIVARLAVSGLGELEVRHDGWHVRVRRAAPDAGPSAAGSGGHGEAASPVDPVASTGGAAAGPTSSGGASSVRASASATATSPAVGYVAPRAEVGVGARASQGDVLGWVDVLGVRQEVVAPVDGLVGKWLVEAGDPVEYGQELVQLVPGGARPGRPGVDGTEA